MTTGTWTIIPPLIVLKNNGKIQFDDLQKKLVEIDQGRFLDSDLHDILRTYINCLKEEGNFVIFDKNAKRYAKHGIYERNLQFILHSAIPEMEKWQLYPLKTRKNSSICYIGVPWEIIPRDFQEVNYINQCDFRWDGEDNCTLGCGVDEKNFR